MEEVVNFFKRHFSTAEFNLDQEDEVVLFCQAHPAGNFGAPFSATQTAAIFCGYTQKIENTINDAWL